MVRLIIMGPAGSGKGTQGKVISQKYGVPVISTGSLLREKASVGDELGKQINDLITKGMIVPIDIITKILYDRLASEDCKNCKTMYNKFYKNTTKEGICDVCGSTEFFVRNDDANIDAINKRLDIYEEMSNTIIEYYNKKNLIYNIDAVKSIDNISQDIDNIITNYINK